MPEDYRFKLQLRDGSYLPECLKLGYVPSIGDRVIVSGTDYEVLCVGLVKGILYKIQVERSRNSTFAPCRAVLRKIGGLEIWQNFRTIWKM